MIEIPVTKGYVTLVDDADADLADHRWLILATGGLCYARRYVRTPEGKQLAILLHREILARTLGEPLTSTQHCDHVNGDGLDNRRENLRLASPLENGRNRRIGRNNTSGVTGVYWDKVNSKWVAFIKTANKPVYLGRFDELEDAAQARQTAEREYFGEFSPTLSRGIK